MALRKALADAQNEANDVRKLLDKEVIGSKLLYI